MWKFSWTPKQLCQARLNRLAMTSPSKKRLDIVNHVWLVILKGSFCLCPKNNGAIRVLDLGSGTGIWFIDHADAFPDAHVVGINLSPIQPGYTHFRIATLSWMIWRKNGLGAPRSTSFSLEICFSNWEASINQAYAYLALGGWFEIQDSEGPAACDDGSMAEDSAIAKYTTMFADSCTKIGRPINLTHTFDALLRKIGFINVVKVPLKFPVSPWPKNKHFKEIGLWTQTWLMSGLEAMALATFTRTLGWTGDETLILCAQARADIKNLKIHAYWNGYAIYGQKPLDPNNKNK